MKNRLNYFDVVRFFAVMWIFFTHYIAAFKPDIFRFWNTSIGYLFLYGITGNFAVVVLSVILGYFAYYSGMKSTCLFGTIVKRYISFFIMALLSNFIYAYEYGYDFSSLYTFYKIIRTSILLSDTIYETFWCIRSFFFGSVISQICGHLKISEPPIILLILLLSGFDNIWVAMCLMGNLLYLRTDFANTSEKWEKMVTNHRVQLIMFVFSFFAIKQPESDVTFFFGGICSLFVLMIIKVNSTVQAWFNNPIVAFLGKNSMGIFLLHPVIYQNVAEVIFAHTSLTMSTFFIGFFISACITILLSIILVYIIDKSTDLSYRLLRYCITYCISWLRCLVVI